MQSLAQCKAPPQLQCKKDGLNTPMLAVGTKCDLRDDPDREDMVSIQQGIEMAEKVRERSHMTSPVFWSYDCFYKKLDY